MFEDLDKKCRRSTVCSKILSGTGTNRRKGKGSGYEQALGFIWDSSLYVQRRCFKMIAKNKVVYKFV